jgi:hypothetical protein
LFVIGRHVGRDELLAHIQGGKIEKEYLETQKGGYWGRYRL